MEEQPESLRLKKALILERAILRGVAVSPELTIVPSGKWAQILDVCSRDSFCFQSNRNVLLPHRGLEDQVLLLGKIISEKRYRTPKHSLLSSLDLSKEAASYEVIMPKTMQEAAQLPNRQIIVNPEGDEYMVSATKEGFSTFDIALRAFRAEELRQIRFT